MPPSHEIRGWSRLVAGFADRVLVDTVHDMHRTISHGAFRWVGPIGRPLEAAYDTVTDGIYDAVRASLRMLGELGAVAADHLGTEEATPSPAATKARAIAHGVVNEDLIALAPELDIDLTLRHEGRDLPADPEALQDAYPDASDRIAVFLHGLVDSEDVWFTRPDEGPMMPHIAAELGVTAVLVRYGTGRAVGHNGDDLTDLLEDLVASWPVPVAELQIVGHSMGGLVARAAGYAAVSRGHTWTSSLTDIVYLGTPHLGSWLEKAANVGTWTMRHSSRYSAPIGTLIDARSRGIKDLRYGTLLEDGWGDTPIDDLLTGLVPDEPWSEGVTHHLIVGRLRASVRHPLNAVFGDALVRTGSASGVGKRRRIGVGGEVVVVPVEASHTRLARHPAVTEVVADVLGRRRPGRPD